ncbi:Bifunctional oligoribonuclease and PAP phosphatase NrnA [Emticicia aquatica]|jgi:phosphoesterase RecJ-like protein|uniref:Bifunctional oligoribonuclease and PAP phosphatase NrnA n=1 Tax=Emticicia aquatica TaxID=1681835 RepID=A0ABM9ARU7_9BACT|nr:bifunctional oligoribonuclease/PAP phosphatase NrnA [Emticicia aquatica]CAH0996030.1 Bifunctional oligoribonuclease and PAP phosphatase NrnA [Emticicia aquatica]
MQEFFTESNQKLKSFNDLLSQPKKIVITTHQNPDADALGSSLGLAAYLKKKGHFPTVITPTDYPDFLKWMAGEKEIINFEGDKQDLAKKLIAEAEMIFCLDFSALNRIKHMEEFIKNSSAPKVLVDHHQQPENFADFVFWNEKAAATCELIYELIEKLGDKNLIDIPLAECLYAGLVTDTGSFRFDSTTKEIHRIAGELIAVGIHTNGIHRKIFDSNSFERMKFLGFALGEKLTYLPEYNVAYMAISREELSRFGSKNGDTEGIVNYGLAIKGVVMAAIFTERDDMIRISFRSVDSFSVSEFSRTHFNGGGHKNAAGGRSHETLSKTVEKFLALLPKYQNELLNNLP